MGRGGWGGVGIEGRGEAFGSQHIFKVHRAFCSGREYTILAPRVTSSRFRFIRNLCVGLHRLDHVHGGCNRGVRGEGG
jgi:hypothetical protein